MIVVILVIFFAISFFSNLQNIEDEAGTETINTEYESNITTEAETQTEPEQHEYKNFYTIPPSLWPKITIGGTFTAVITYVALIFGIASYFIGHNAGGRLAKGKIFAAIGTATIVGIVGTALPF